MQGAAAALMRREEALGIGGAGGAAATQLPGPSEQPFPRAGHWQDLHYHGDWLKRPIASNEVRVAWPLAHEHAAVAGSVATGKTYAAMETGSSVL